MALKHLRKTIHDALREDAAKEDITVNTLVSEKTRAKAHVIVKQRGILCGLDVVAEVFHEMDPYAKIMRLSTDAKLVRPGSIVMMVNASARALLSAERTALNFLGHLSGVATLTRRFVDTLKGTKIKIYDTRKTTPGLRELEKYAVTCGGGHNHRMDLKEMAMVKDNHYQVLGTLKDELLKFKKIHPDISIEVECESIQQVRTALEARADIIMLDNMSFFAMQEAIGVIRGFPEYHPDIELSGGVTLETIERYSKLDVDRISIGAFTHSAPALDVSMEIVDE